MPKQQPIISELFFSFMKVGLFTFGGGYAMNSVITETCVEKKQWLTQDEMMDLTVVAESTPGPIAINAATFVGYRTCGFLGAAAATFGIVLPSFLIITIIAAVLNEFAELRAVQYAFFGIRAGVLALIVKALWSMYKQCPKNTFSMCVAAAAFVLAAFSGINAIFIIIGCATAGLIHSLVISKKAKEEQK